ncbi:MAG TPA: hypothetical protein PKC29_00615 [Thermodesulfobacteriota bacterium]|nr:hypothetical protein [Thermodesulfobacteriota bacterium]
MKRLSAGVFTALLLLVAFSYMGRDAHAQDAFEYNSNQVLHPEWFIKVTDWSFYTAARVAILSSVTIENNSDVTYRDVRVKLLYTSYPAPVAGIIATSTTTLPVTLPPKSKATYLKGGMTVGAGEQSYKLSDVVVISATAVKD